MIKIKLYELNKHRNETTFRPLLFIKDLFSDVGIEFVTTGRADFAFIGQASICDKKLSLQDSTDFGLSFLKSVAEPYFILDGQDSTSLIGVYEIFRKSNALLLLKNNLLIEKKLYGNNYVNGRYFWGKGNYGCENICDLESKIRLSGFNWLNTYGNDIDIIVDKTRRIYDVCSLFGLSGENYEHQQKIDSYYNTPRINIFKQIANARCNIVSSEHTGKLDKKEYLNVLSKSKICISPYGYGEIAIRDIEAILYGCILIKPDMSFVNTIPNIYDDDKTFISCRPDYSDLLEKIYYILDNYHTLHDMFYTNIHKKIIIEFSKEKLVRYYYDIFVNIPNVTTN